MFHKGLTVFLTEKMYTVFTILRPRRLSQAFHVSHISFCLYALPSH